MLEFSAYLAAQQTMQDEVLPARSLSHAQATSAPGNPGFRFIAARRRTSAVLRRLADFIAVMPEAPVSTLPVAHRA